MAERSRIVPTLEIEGEAFDVLGFRLEEALSEVPILEVEATQQDVEPKDPKELVGKTAKLLLTRTGDLQERKFHGRVVAALRGPSADDVRTLRFEIAPHPWALTKRHDSRVFQQLSAVDIAKEVFEKAGIGAAQQDWRTADHPARKYLVQYRETDYAFVTRILAEEGIYFVVHHDGDEEKVVLSDEAAGVGEIEGDTTLPFRHAHGGQEADDFVTRLSQTQRVATDKVTLSDYNFEKPKLKVTATVEADGDGEKVLEVYDYPARAAEPSEAERLAQIALEAKRLRHSVVTGETASLAVRPGLRFTIEGHPYGPLNGELMVLRVIIEAATDRLGQIEDTREKFRCFFEAVPTATVVRPPQPARQTEIVGIQTAFTTGAAGEEIHVNDGGAVKIRYHWDRLGPEDDGSSDWMRTLQLALGGSMLLPRVGWEVSVNHFEGDPDRAMVMGRMYNGTTPPPYNLPDEAGKSSLQTATTPGGGSVNEMRTGDAAGSEELYFNASKDCSVTVKNNTTESVGANASRSIGSNQSKSVTNSTTQTIGGSQTVTVGGNQTVGIETKFQDEIGADHSLSVGGNRTMMIGGDHKVDVGADSSLTVGGMMVDLIVGSSTEEILGSYSHTVGAALVDITASDRTLTVGGNITETAGAAKIIGTMGGRGVDVGGALMQKVAGAVVNVTDGDRVEEAGGTYTEIAAGANIVKADNITIEADGMLTLVMGGSILSLTPASAAFIGVSIKLDGKVADMGALIVDN